MPYLICY